MEGVGGDKSQKIEDPNAEICLPLGAPIGAELSAVLGDVFQSWNFLCCFHEVLGLEKLLSLEELTTELTGQLSGGLFDAHVSILRILLDDMQIELKRGGKSETGCSTKVKTSKNDVLILNKLTWPELARRYAFVSLSLKGRLDSSQVRDDIFVSRCLHGDGGPPCGALTGIAGLRSDTLLLAQATNTVYGSLNHEEDKLFIDDIISESGSTMTNDRVPDWVQELESVKDLPTNVGSRIKKYIQSSIEKCPPEWAKNVLEQSISKEFYKGNAAGPTKNAARCVVALFHNLQKNIALNKKRGRFISISEIVIEQCHILLRQTANDFCKSFGGKGIIGSPAILTRPLDFRAIDMRLKTGAYCRSHQAFAEDVQELLSSLPPTCSKFARKFEQDYNNEIVALHQKLLQYSNLVSLNPELKKEIEDIIISARATQIPKAPWDEGVCKVCGIDQDDDRVLLCDSCDAEYHTYCLSPPLARVPKDKWYCPKCAAKKVILQDTSASASASACQQNKEKEGEFMNLVLEETNNPTAMLWERNYWELTALQRTCLLKFFCDEMLNSETLRKHMEECKSRTSNKFPFENKFLGIDSAGRLYWKLDAGSRPCIIVNERMKPCQDVMVSHDSKSNCLVNDFGSSEVDDHCIVDDLVLGEVYGSESLAYSSWVCYQSDTEIQRILDFIKDDKFLNGKLDESILLPCKAKREVSYNLKRQDCEELQSSSSVMELDRNSVGLDYSLTKASRLLLSNDILFTMHRCECLELIFPGRLHCFCCHKSCISRKEFQSHGDLRCNIHVTLPFEVCDSPKGEGTSSVHANEIQSSRVINAKDVSAVKADNSKRNQILEALEEKRIALLSQKVDPDLDMGKFFEVPPSSKRQLTGESLDVLKHLKISLLDMEAALSQNALRSAKACIERKQNWRAFVKRAATIYEMVQAMLVFEDMVKPDYLGDSWRNWSSISAAAKISTLAALSLRLYSLDAAIRYNQMSSSTPNPPKLDSEASKEKRKHNRSSTGEKRRKLTETREQVTLEYEDQIGSQL